MKTRTSCSVFLLAALVSTLEAQETSLKIERLMTPDELRESGVAKLTTQQRDALNHWLNRYTRLVVSVTKSSKSKAPSAPIIGRYGSGCSPAIESSISGDFEGWEGETVFKLDNGQIWEQAEYDYTYDYEYHPDVTIYQTPSGCRMKVEGLEETILVRRIK